MDSESVGLTFLERCRWNPVSITSSYSAIWDREDFDALPWTFNYHMPNLESLTLVSGYTEAGIVFEYEPEEVLEVWEVNPNTQ
jgi:hypothetical protein